MMTGDIGVAIKNILEKRFEIGFHITEEFMTSALTAPPFSLDAVRLYQLLMCIEEEFNIYFMPQEIVDGDFKTIWGIQNAISEKIRL